MPFHASKLGAEQHLFGRAVVKDNRYQLCFKATARKRPGPFAFRSANKTHNECRACQDHRAFLCKIGPACRLGISVWHENGVVL